jgi:hypothetical protein
MLILTRAFIAFIIVSSFAIGVWVGYSRKQRIDDELDTIGNFTLPTTPKGGAEFYEPTDTETEALEKVMKANAEKGRDTKLDDVTG